MRLDKPQKPLKFKKFNDVFYGICVVVGVENFPETKNVTSCALLVEYGTTDISLGRFSYMSR